MIFEFLGLNGRFAGNKREYGGVPLCDYSSGQIPNVSNISWIVYST